MVERIEIPTFKNTLTNSEMSELTNPLLFIYRTVKFKYKK